MIYSMLGANFIEQYWPVLVLLVALIALYVVSMIRKKRDMTQVQQMINELKPGTKVKTYTGFYGVIDSVRETTDGKVVMLRIGEEGGKTAYIEIDANAIYGIDTKTDVVYDAQGNVIVKEDKKEKEEVKTILEDKAKPIKKEKKHQEDEKDKNKNEIEKDEKKE